MNRERLSILRDHLAGLPDERVDMRALIVNDDGDVWSAEGMAAALHRCGTAACIAGWTNALFNPADKGAEVGHARRALDLSDDQMDALFTPEDWSEPRRYTRSDAIAAIQSMLDSPDDDALPVWPEKAS